MYTILKLYPEALEDKNYIPKNWINSLKIPESDLLFETHIHKVVEDYYFHKVNPSIVFYPNEAKIKIWSEASMYYLWTDDKESLVTLFKDILEFESNFNYAAEIFR